MTGSAASTRTRSIVLVPSRHALMDEIDAALTARSWEPIIVHEPTAALAELAALERSQQTRTNWGLLRAVTSALVLVQPNDWPEVVDLLDATTRYFPHAQIWTYENGRLSPLKSGDTRNNHESFTADRDHDVDRMQHERAYPDAEEQRQRTASEARPSGATPATDRAFAQMGGTDAPQAPVQVSATRSMHEGENTDSPCDEAAREEDQRTDESRKEIESEPSSASTVTRDELDMLLETTSEPRSS